jgi:hypothetical protein
MPGVAGLTIRLQTFKRVPLGASLPTSTMYHDRSHRYLLERVPPYLNTAERWFNSLSEGDIMIKLRSTTRAGAGHGQ